MTSIGYGAFNSENIAIVASLTDSPSKIDSSVFSQNTRMNATLYIPKRTIEKYKATGGWKDFTNMVELLRGDANGDGKVDMDDATFVTNIILGTEDATEAADVNNDGTVSMPDAMFIVNRILNGKFPDEK